MDTRGHRVAQGLILAAAFCLAVTPSLAPSANADEASGAKFEQTVRPFLTEHCYLCHSEQLQTSGLRLDKFQDAEAALRQPDVWEQVLEKLHAGAMPPQGQPRPDPKAVKTVTDWISQELERLAKNMKPDPGRVTARRLNREEYNNTIRDLVGVDFRPADDFPADDAGYGFDNIGDVLSLSPLLMEKYLTAANQIASRAVVAPPVWKPTLDKFLAPRAQEKDADGPIPFSQEGSLELSYNVPVDAEYELTFHIVDRRYRPKKDEPPPPIPPPAHLAVALDGEPVDTFEVEAGPYQKRDFEVRVPAEKGSHQIHAFFPDGAPKPDAAEAGANKKDPYAGERKLFVDTVEIQGPFNTVPPPLTASHRKIFVCGHGIGEHEPGCAQKILSTLVRRAYRRPITQDEIDALKRFVELAQSEGDSFEKGIQVALKAVLVSPKFLFRIEDDPVPTDPEAAHPINQYELATRLSYFLWSSMPDDQLFEKATQLRLRKPDVLQAEIRRMIDDEKSQAFVENFAGQWLQLRNVESVSPDPELFPNFDEDLREAMRRETEKFFETLMREDRSILDFIDGRYTFLNRRLAMHYGIPDIEGDDFRRVALSGEQRSGVLTQASILTVSSYPTRTSPVLRGKWLLENFLNAPPPPPPADVPELDEAKVGISGTLREQLEQHRANPSCAVCHDKIDPLGFALENYNAVGQWRTHDGEFPIDSSGTLPSGETFENSSELKQILKSDPDVFTRAFVEKMLTYALGRGLERYDRPTVEKITQRGAANDYRFSEVVLGIVESMPFQMRRGEEATNDPETAR